MKSVFAAFAFSCLMSGVALAQTTTVPAISPMSDSAEQYEKLSDADKIDYHERCIADLSIYGANVPREELMTAAMKAYDMQVLQAAILLKTEATEAVVSRPGVDRYVKIYKANDYSQFKKTYLPDTNSCIHNAEHFMKLFVAAAKSVKL
jgi:hypothetical protein